MKSWLIIEQLYTQLKQLKQLTNLQCDQLPDGLIAQLVEYDTGIAEAMGSNPVQAWIVTFFQALISQLLNWWSIINSYVSSQFK